MNDKTKIDDGGMLYPIPDIKGYHQQLGITPRDWLAGLAMQGLLSDPKFKAGVMEQINEVLEQLESEDESFERNDKKDRRIFSQMASLTAYEVADAVIAEGRKGE